MSSLSRYPTSFTGQIVVALIAAALLTSSVGCIGAMTQLMYVIKGHKVPAAYPGMEGKTVAVVCVSDASAYGPDTLTYTISKTVSMKLANGVKDISVVSPHKIEQWVDTNGWGETDFVEIGRGVNADLVLAIEIGSYTIKEGQTMYKGRTDLTCTVFDITKDGQVAFVDGPRHFAFPEHGRPAIQTSARQFETVFLAKLTQNIARQFTAHDQTETVAEDASLLSY